MNTLQSNHSIYVYIRHSLFLFFMGMVLFPASATTALSASPDTQTLTQRQQWFLQAGKAYDEDRQDTAIDLYEQIINSGYAAPELFYNLGNSYFKKGNLPIAILNYRKALYLSPRDPDVRANLEFALNAAGALVTPPGLRTTLFRQLSLSGWVIFLICAYWLCASACCVWLRFPQWRTTVSRLIFLLAFFCIVSTSAIMYWNGLRRHPEAVITQTNQQVLFAPIEGSTIHFEIPAGSIIRILESQGSWSKISVDKKEGWVKQSIYQIVYPWHMP